MIEREKCPHFSWEDVSVCDVFDHPTYKYYCSKNGKKKEIFTIHCARCSFLKDLIEKEKMKNERK